MRKKEDSSLVIPKSTLSRLPLYYSHIQKMQLSGEEYVSAAAIAQSLHLNPVLVRKDLAGVSSTTGKTSHIIIYFMFFTLRYFL